MNSAATVLEPAEQSTELPKVVVVGTGGTIHSVGKNSLDIVRYGENKTMYDVTELLAKVTETALVTQPVPIPYKAVGSPSIGPEIWVELVDVITKAVDEHQPAGVVVGKVGSVFTASPPGPRQPAGMLIVVNEGPALPCMLSS